MKKNKKIFLLILLLTIISTLPIFLIKDLPYGGDLNFHLKRIEAIVENIKSGYIGYPISFKYLNNYGYANGLFYPDLFLYIPALLNIIGINLFQSYKIFLFIIKFSSLISIYISVKGITKKENSGIMALILYAFSSYCFIDMFERGALAETLTIIFVPLVIRGLYEILYINSKKCYFLILGMLGILYSHVISTYLISTFILLFIIINYKKLCKEKVLKILKSVFIIALIGTHFILPLSEQILNNKFYFNNMSSNSLKSNSVPMLLLFPEIPYYTLLGQYTDKWIPCGIGIIYAWLTYYAIKNKTKINKIGKTFIVSGLICMLFASNIIWNFGILNNIFSVIQFPFRIYILATNLFIFAFSIEFANKDLKFIKRIFIISIILFSMNLIYPFINIKTKTLTKDEILYGEYLPIEYPSLDYQNERKNKIISTCNLKYNLNYRIKTIVEYETSCEKLNMELPIIYYKGYEVKINNDKVNIKKSKNGLIEINTEIKKGKMEIFYTGTKIYKVTKYISILGFIIIIIEIRKNKYEKK